MRWAIAILWLAALVAHAAPNDATFQKLARQAEEARLADRLPEAVQSYRRAVELHPAWSEGWWWLGSIYYDQDLYAEARIAFEHALPGEKKQVPAYGFLGLCAYEMRDYAAARAYLSKWQAAGAPGDASLVDVAGFRSAELLTQDGRFFEALFLLNSKVYAHGPDPSLVEAMGLAWMQMKNVPEDYPPEKREMVWLAGSAAAWFSASKTDRAQEFLDRLATHYGDRPNVHFLRGFVAEAMKDYEAAIEEYGKELKVAPQAVATMIQLAQLYVEAGRNDEALQLARQAVTLEPGNARSHFALGRVLLAKQQWADSAAELEKAKDFSPGAPAVRFQLARVYRKLNRKQDSEREDAAFEALNKKEEEHPAVEYPASLARYREGRAR
jgi:tetratricopeptide (TPR) repeat protein